MLTLEYRDAWKTEGKQSDVLRFMVNEKTEFGQYEEKLTKKLGDLLERVDELENGQIV